MKNSSSNLTVQRNQLGDQAYSLLRKAIVTGRFKAGERLVERRLSSVMGTSRTPLREAMIRLEQEGLLSGAPVGGMAVTRLNEQKVRELYAIRIGLESYATRLAAEAHDEAALAELRAVVNKARSKLEPMDLRALEDLNNVFHKTLYSIPGMKRLAEVIESYREQAIRHRIYDVYTPGEVCQGVTEHGHIVTALARRDAGEAESLIRAHISNGARIVLERRVRG